MFNKDSQKNENIDCTQDGIINNLWASLDEAKQNPNLFKKLIVFIEEIYEIT